MGQVARVEVVEYTDVMCSWAWGSDLCGPNAEPSSGAKTYDWGDGVVYLRPELYPAI